MAFQENSKITIAANIKNIGSDSRTIFVGCSIFAPDGYRTDSADFTNWYDGTSQDSKEITLDQNQSGIIKFYETLGPATPPGTHTVVIALWREVPFTEPSLDDASTTFVVTEIVAATITSITVV